MPKETLNVVDSDTGLEEDREDTFKEGEARNEFFASGEFLLCPDKSDEGQPNCYLWDDYELLNKTIEDRSAFYWYTLIEEEGTWIVEGRRWVNRLGYFLSKKEAKVGNGIRY